MNIINDIVFSMLSYSKNYYPYTYDWGRRVGKDIVRERLELEGTATAKTQNIFEQGIVAGAMEQIISRKMTAPRPVHPLQHYHSMRMRNIGNSSDPSLLKVAYPHINISSGSHTLLYWIGREAGMMFGKSHARTIGELERISNKLEIGNVEARKNKIVLKDSAFAANAERGKISCSYYAGFAAGFLGSPEKILSVIETKCRARGDKHCEFEIL